jgi:hypothetical protein
MESAVPPFDLPSAPAEDAAAEQRSGVELMQDAFDDYLREKRWQQRLESYRARAESLGLDEGEVFRLVAEHREEHRRRP